MRLVRIATPTRGAVDATYSTGLLLLQQSLSVVESPFGLQAVDFGRDHFITARNVLLHNALESPADLLLWMDGDCSPAFTEADVLYQFLRAAQQTDGILGARAVRRGGGWNVVGDNYDTPHPHEVERIGLDFTVYNLRWFRGAFAKCVREHGGNWAAEVLSAKTGKPVVSQELRDGGVFCRMSGQPSRPNFFEWFGGVGEDYRACQWVKDHGGQVRLDPRMPTWHDGKVWTGLRSSLVLS